MTVVTRSAQSAAFTDAANLSTCQDSGTMGAAATLERVVVSELWYICTWFSPFMLNDASRISGSQQCPIMHVQKQVA